jgi:2'-5' RNA ligase
MSESLPLILTLKLDSKTFGYFNQLRQQHFPPGRNFLPAHVTLFHALPDEHRLDVQKVLRTLYSHTSVLSLTFPKLRFLGKGVAVEVDCPELVQLRHQLATTWKNWLSRQDQQGYRPHITIQNKATPNEARQLYEQLTSEWMSFGGYGEGLLLWQYKGGPWELINELDFK